MPTMQKGAMDALAAKGEVIANADPLAVALREREQAGPSRRGFDIGMAVAEGQTLEGPGKDKIRDELSEAERIGFNSAVQFSLERNKNAHFAAIGAAIAAATPVLAKARTAHGSPLYSLGFDIATGIFGDPALGAQGNTASGPGSLGIRDWLSPIAQLGFNAAMELNMGPPPLRGRPQ